jgi:hypothetical protein
MPKAKDPMTEKERSRRFEEEVRKRKAAGDFDQHAADEALDALVKRQSQRGKHPPSAGD